MMQLFQKREQVVIDFYKNVNEYMDYSITLL